MDKINENTEVTANDLAFLQKELSRNHRVVVLNELAEKLAYKKNASQLSQAVKKYDPDCRYEVGDLIYKEYDEPLLVSSKSVELFKASVVLKVVNKISYDSYHCEMLEVDYTGGGIFRKHIDYMKKSKTQVLLPSAMDGKAREPEILKKEEDPRYSELPMTDKDLRLLKKNLEASLSKSEHFFNWKSYWQLTENLTEISKADVEKIEAHLKKSEKSAATTDLVSRFFKIKPDAEDFDLHCIALNHTIEKKFKKNFVFVSPENWGKWFLKDLIDSYLKQLPLSPALAKVPPLEETDLKPVWEENQEFPLKIYLTWREVLSGGLTIPKNLVRELSCAREYVFTDTESDEEYTAYFYPSKGIFLGLSDFYAKNHVTQGASLTLEKKAPTHINFWVKKAKRKLTVPQVDYNFKKDVFTMGEKETTTHSLPNKILFLESATLQKLFTLYKLRRNLDLRELLILVFKNFGLEGEALSLHFQRAFHLVDIIRHTHLNDVEKVLLYAPEFAMSEKKKGLFLYQEKIKTEEELMPEKPEAKPADITAEIAAVDISDDELPEIGTVGEVETPTVILEEPVEAEPRVELPPTEPAEPTPPPPRAKREAPVAEEKAPPAKPEKEPKKKRRRAKVETDKAPRRRKGERKLIEERIEQEESELEALFAVKSKEKIDLEVEAPKVAKPKEKKIDFTPEAPEEPLSGVFGEMLKSALKQKPADQAKEKPAKKKPAKKTAPKKPKAATKPPPDKK